MDPNPREDGGGPEPPEGDGATAGPSSEVSPTPEIRGLCLEFSLISTRENEFYRTMREKSVYLIQFELFSVLTVKKMCI